MKDLWTVVDKRVGLIPCVTVWLSCCVFRRLQESLYSEGLGGLSKYLMRVVVCVVKSGVYRLVCAV